MNIHRGVTGLDFVTPYPTYSNGSRVDGYVFCTRFTIEWI